MKKALLTLMCMAAMMAAGRSIMAQEVTIILTPGWNWIGIPSTDTLDFATALGSFTPVVGDIIKSRWSYATYMSNGQWRGSISQFHPGYGYMYYSNRTMPVFLTFNVQQPAPQVVVTTSEPMLITAISAMGGGEVTVSDGTYIIVKGLCWATHENPTTNDDFYQEAESGVGSFSISMTDLNIGTTYYVRAYAVTPNGTVYGDQKTFTTKDGIPTLTTAEVTNIGIGWAYCGGDITDNGGLNVTARGVCWSTSTNPTVADSHTTNGSGTGSFSSSITGLSVSTTYYVRAYATTTAGTGYGEERTFTTLEDAYVDLGLPSGVLWATYNVGAEYPEAYGNHFAWGETQPKDTYNWNNYQYCNGSNNTLTKYCNNSSYGFNGFTDNLTMLLPEDDAATANWGADWRMPTKNEWQELLDNTDIIWTTQNGVKGRLFTASNGNTLFLPAAGYRNGSNLYGADSYGFYGVSSLYTVYPFTMWNLIFSSGSCSVGDEPECDRSNGQSVRPVRCKNSVINVTVNPTEGGTLSGGGTYMDHTICTVSAAANENYIFTYWTEDGEVVSTEATYSFTVCGNRNLVANFFTPNYVDLGLPSGLLWATCNVGANVPEDYGDHFAWGETQPKEYYSWNTYQYSNGGNWSNPSLTKYCNNPEYGYNGFTDNLTTLLPEDDAATANWGNDWRIPTIAEWQELYNNTNYIQTTQNDVNGILFTATNGNSLFLPAAGLYDPVLEGYCHYWSNSLYTDHTSSAWGFAYNYDYFSGSYGRQDGLSVRAVRNVPAVTTYMVTDITTTSALVGGQIGNNSEVMESGICYRTEQGEETCIEIPAINNAFFMTLTNLAPYTTYYVRAYASNETGTNYGAEVSFTTGEHIAPNGTIDGLFSVSASKQVYFSQGNLQYKPSTNTWRFADKQYDLIIKPEDMTYYYWDEINQYYYYCADVSSHYTSTYNDWIDLFGWGTSGYHDVNDPYNVNYQPWSTSTSQVNSSYNYYGYGPSTNMTAPNLTGTSANYDWGVYNPISNGGNTANQWRTLTRSEWNYVFYIRTTTSGIRYAMATVNGVSGVILLPDDWNINTYILNNTNDGSASFSSNIVSASQWIVLENAGAVFLPAAGWRDRTSVKSVGLIGGYWSTSSHVEFYGSGAYIISFDGMISIWDYSRCSGWSVRLVYVAE